MVPKNHAQERKNNPKNIYSDIIERPLKNQNCSQEASDMIEHVFTSKN